jgi:signal transduction histidine kinase
LSLGKYASIAVVDSSGKVIGTMGDIGAEGPLEGPGIERVALPGGGYLIARTQPASDAWPRYARAFIHEARSPLNALAIYLELLSSRLASAIPKDRPEASPDRILAKANDQIRRVEELLRSFGELWGARGEKTALSEMVSAASRFSEHEALRLGLTFSSTVVPGIVVGCSPRPVADALVLLLGAVFRAPPESQVAVSLSPQGERAVALSVEVISAQPPAVDLLQAGAEALRLAGGRVEREGQRVSATFSRVSA